MEPAKDLEQQKLALEIEKLQAEIRGPCNRWYVPAIIQAMPAALLVVATFVVALATGIFDAKRVWIEVTNERLKIEQHNLEQQNAVERRELARYQHEAETIRKLQESFPFSFVFFLRDLDGLAVVLEGFNFGGGSLRFTDAGGNVLSALEEIDKLENVKHLQLVKVGLDGSEAERLSKMRIERICMTEMEIGDSVIRQLAKNKSLKVLGLDKCTVSEAVVAELKRDRPDIKVGDGIETAIQGRILPRK